MARRVLHIMGDAGYAGTGIARIVSMLARDIDSQKYQIHACFVGKNGPLVTEFEKLGISTQVVRWRHPSRDPIGLVRLWWQLRDQEFDIVHLHWGGRVVRWVARNACNAQIILHLHGRDESRPDEATMIPTGVADQVIAVSRAVANISSHRRTSVVYSGVDVPNDVPSHQKQATIGTAGRLVPLKGIRYLLRAMATLKTEFPNLRLEIAGTGPEMSNLVREAESLGLSDCVEFLGWVSNLSSPFARWAIFVQPSLEEALGIAVLEAMAAGLPVVASAVGGLPEIVVDGQTGKLVPPADPTAVADCLRNLLLDPVLRARMGEAGLARVRQSLSPEQMVTEISRIYDELAI